MEDPLATGEVTKKKAPAFASRALGFAAMAAAAINAASLRLISRKEAAAWAAKKAEKEAAKAAPIDKEEKFDAFGNKIEEKKTAQKIPKQELKKIKKEIAARRKRGEECFTDDEIEKAGYDPMM